MLLFGQISRTEYTDDNVTIYSRLHMEQQKPPTPYQREYTPQMPSLEQDLVPNHAPLWRVVLQETLQVVLPAIILALVVHLFLAQATIVYGQSMEPNLYERERLIIDKVSYYLHPPRRNDIVVLDMPHMDEMLVKRIVGLPGETVEIRKGVVYINGEILSELFPHPLGNQTVGPVTVGPLNYFVLGDNRENSNDSRAFGPVKREFILGRVWLRYWPLYQIKVF
jgi:signal peptidase I